MYFEPVENTLNPFLTFFQLERVCRKGKQPLVPVQSEDDFDQFLPKTSIK